MNIIKSLIVFVILITLSGLSIRKIYRFFKCPGTKNDLLKGILLCAASLLAILLWGRYTYPFDRQVEFEEYAVIERSEGVEAPTRFPRWYAAYEEYGLYAESRYFYQYTSEIGFSWPSMDLENYTYIISNGRELIELTYNEWDTIYAPIRMGAYCGHAVFKEEYKENIIYIYQIPKMRIDYDDCYLNIIIETD